MRNRLVQLRFPARRAILALLFWAAPPAAGDRAAFASAAASSFTFTPAMLPDDGYTETFSVSADLENGGFVHLQWGITNLGPGSGRGICRVLLVSPTASWRSQTLVSPGDWQIRPDRLEIGGCIAREGERTSFSAKTEEGTLEIMLDEPLIPRSGDVYRSRGKTGTMSIVSLAAGARARVKIHPQQKSAQQFIARVAIEHDLGTVSPDEIGRQWFRFRTVDGAPVLSGVLHRRGKGTEGAGRLVTTATSAVEWTGFTIESIGESTGEPGSSPIVFRGPSRTITLTPVRSIAAYAPLREMGIIGRVLSAIVGNPLLSVLEVTWEEGAGKRKAILEVTTFR